jgi:hypothetical protein
VLGVLGKLSIVGMLFLAFLAQVIPPGIPAIPPVSSEATPNALAIAGLFSVIGLAVAGMITNIGNAVVRVRSAEREAKAKDCEGQLERANARIGELENELKEWKELVAMGRPGAGGRSPRRGEPK